MPLGLAYIEALEASGVTVLNGSRAWSEFGWAISYDPHGSVHTYLGGTVDCNSTYDEVMAISGIKAHADRAQRVYLSNMLRSYVFYALKVRSDAGRETTPESRARDTPLRSRPPRWV